MARVSKGCWVLAPLLACAVTAARAAPAETLEPPEVARTERSGKRHRSRPGAALAGGLAGFGLGLAFGARSGTAGAPLQPLGPADAVVAGATLALFASPRLSDREDPALPRRVPTHELNGFDRTIRKLALGHRSEASRDLLDKISSATLSASVTAPIGLLATSHVPQKWERDLPIVLEATGLSLAITVAVKHVARRSRPIDRFCRDEERNNPCRLDTRLSFYSGHAAASFAAAIASGRIANAHGLENRRWIWGSQLTLATVTSVLRVMADRHYATDVLVGIVTGSLVGWLVPQLHKPSEAPAVTPAAPVRRPTALASIPIALPSGAAMAVTAGVPSGGGIYVGLRWNGR